MKIALLGDIGLFGKFDILSGIDYEDYFSNVIPLLQDMDLVVGNLETPFQDGFKVVGSKSAYIGASQESVGLFRLLNVGCVNLANNHTGDYGEKGYDFTKKVLENNGIEFFGIEDIGFRYENQGSRIAFSGFCNFDTNPCYMNFGGGKGVNTVDYSNVLKLLEKNNEEGWFNVLSFHSGLEHVNYPSLEDVKFSRALSSSVSGVYYGHHPHVVQGVEKINDFLTFYSLGNFCFDDVFLPGQSSPLVTMSPNNRTGMIAILEFKGNKVVSYECVPIYIGKERMLVGADNVPDFNLACYSDRLDIVDVQKYMSYRQSLLSEYYQSRKQGRDLAWYLKRLRPRYIKLLLNARNNHRLYREKYASQLTALGSDLI